MARARGKEAGQDRRRHRQSVVSLGMRARTTPVPAMEGAKTARPLLAMQGAKWMVEAAEVMRRVERKDETHLEAALL